MTKIFFTPLRDPKKRLFLFEILFPDGSSAESFLFKPKRDLQFDIESVKSPEEADVIIEPSPITHGNKALWQNIYKGYGKPYLVQVGGDLSHDIFIDDALVLKVTQYRKLERENEIIMPPFCEDLGSIHGVQLRLKNGKPVVSFCGWAGFSNFKSYIKYLLKNLMIDIKKTLLFDPSLEVFKKGMYFRRKAIVALKDSDVVTPSFIVRKSFSGSANTIGLDPKKAREEYLKNMIESDFVLAPKGDANYSVRFYEALSLGRIPILIDTDTCLPFSETLDYSKFALIVSYKDIKKLPAIVSDFYAKLSGSEWLNMQKEARRAFEEFLRYDSFWNKLLPALAKKA